MEQEFNLERYLSAGVQKIIQGVLKTAWKDPKETILLTRYAKAAKAAEEKRREAAREGENIPPFLIASITGSCNLHCAGCYARESHMCTDEKAAGELTGEEWKRVFAEARELGVGFILLAGGEPLLRRDVLEAASGLPEILFPVFTNGTMMQEAYCSFFDEHRDLVPVFSMEGRQQATDIRRGGGVYTRVLDGMKTLQEKHLTFGVSVTVTTENLEEVASDDFLETLSGYGAKVVFYIEFVPAAAGTEQLAPGEREREAVERLLNECRSGGIAP